MKFHSRSRYGGALQIEQFPRPRRKRNPQLGLNCPTPPPRRTRFDTVSRCGVELCLSLQIAILKVLVSHPEGRATIAALNSDLCILNTSGSDWTNRLRRLAARAPGLDIFGQRLILRHSSGWQITPEGRAFLDWLERGAASANVPVAEPSPNARFPEAANDNGMAWLSIPFPDGWYAPVEVRSITPLTLNLTFLSISRHKKAPDDAGALSCWR